jgi:SAM-dependent methyltransferase
MTSALREAQARHFDTHTPFTPASHALRASGFRYPYILKDVLISRAISQILPAPGQRVLDLGCGRGILLDRLATSFRTRGFGVDISRSTLKGMQSESLHPHHIACSEGENLPFRDNSFDLALSLDVLEHVEAPERILAEMLRVLKPGGVVLCYAISRENGLTFNWFLTEVFELLGVDHWAWNGHAADRLVDPVRTKAYLESTGCQVHYFRPFHSFFTVLYDQSVLVLYWLAAHLRLPTRPRGANDRPPNRMLRLVSALTGVLFRPFDRLDRPWVSRGLSNGFLFAATKPPTSSMPGRPS